MTWLLVAVGMFAFITWRRESPLCMAVALLCLLMVTADRPWSLSIFQSNMGVIPYSGVIYATAIYFLQSDAKVYRPQYVILASMVLFHAGLIIAGHEEAVTTASTMTAIRVVPASFLAYCFAVHVLWQFNHRVAIEDPIAPILLGCGCALAQIADSILFFPLAFAVTETVPVWVDMMFDGTAIKVIFSLCTIPFFIWVLRRKRRVTI